MPAADASRIDFVAAGFVLDDGRRAADASRFVFVVDDDDRAKHDAVEHDRYFVERFRNDVQLGHDDGTVELEHVLDDDPVAIGYDVLVIGDDGPKKLARASVGPAGDARSPVRGVAGTGTGSRCPDDTGRCAAALRDRALSGEVRNQRRTCVHWIRVRDCARGASRQHRRLGMHVEASASDIAAAETWSRWLTRRL